MIYNIIDRNYLNSVLIKFLVIITIFALSKKLKYIIHNSNCLNKRLGKKTIEYHLQSIYKNFLNFVLVYYIYK